MPDGRKGNGWRRTPAARSPWAAPHRLRRLFRGGRWPCRSAPMCAQPYSFLLPAPASEPKPVLLRRGRLPDDGQLHLRCRAAGDGDDAIGLAVGIELPAIGDL